MRCTSQQQRALGQAFIAAAQGTLATHKRLKHFYFLGLQYRSRDGWHTHTLSLKASSTWVRMRDLKSYQQEFGELTELGKIFRRCRDKTTPDLSAKDGLARCLRKHRVAEERSGREGAKKGRKSKNSHKKGKEREGERANFGRSNRWKMIDNA